MIQTLKLELQAPAKVNLGLKILRRRPNGYHELDSRMLPISLEDTLWVELGGQGIRVHCPGHENLDGPANLAGRAAAAWLEASPCQKGLGIVIKKRIPQAAGLGGGSSNAASLLLALNRLLPPLPEASLARLALQLGADVPFFLQAGPCRAQGLGEILTALPHLPSVWFILACAPFGLSTRDVFNGLNLRLTSDGGNVSYNRPRMGFRELVTDLRNDLQPVAEAMQPSIGDVCKNLVKAGAHGATMSGSGPSVVGLFPTRNEARQAIRRLLRDEGWTYQVVKGITSVLASRIQAT
ncbi:MAG: 4-(cytidine 5'-diphospho)-2-C-methyl-D-erythritol kinase [Deltaproteobacteria bacterium]|nr:4-(cytidine 5'-diphospho)-2-C-methyl-D-erythritol kinase [Deltaproteobacteria bacterium]